MTDHPEAILILDFGSQVAQLIARRVREAGVYCELVPFSKGAEALERLDPRGVILSGSPASVADAGAPRAPDALFARDIPVLGICYGEQTMAAQLGGAVLPSTSREFGRGYIDIVDTCRLFDGLWAPGERHQVWMSHGDRIDAVPPGFRAVATTDGAPFAAIADDVRRRYGVQFHPEVVHTPDGARLLANFVRHVCGCTATWRMDAYRAAKVAEIRAQVGNGRVICGLSGGVDSAVAAVLIHEAIGDQLTCVFVDHGLLRAGEGDAGRRTVPRALRHPAGPRRRRRPVHGRRLRASPTPRPSANSSARPSSKCSRPRRRRSAGRSSSRKARSTPT